MVMGARADLSGGYPRPSPRAPSSDEKAQRVSSTNENTGYKCPLLALEPFVVFD
jgi:hypothetical protein